MRFLAPCVLLLAVAVALAVSAASAGFPHQGEEDPLASTVARLQDILSAEQASKDESPLPPIRWGKRKGLYDSYVHLNFHGKPEMVLARDAASYPDDNGFTTSFVVNALLESHRLGAIPLRVEEIQDAVTALLKFRDENTEAGVPSFMFWRQELVNGTFVETPQNMQAILDGGDSISQFMVKLLNTLGLHKAADLLHEFDEFVEIMELAMRIPGDSDDTNCNLALGWTLNALSAELPQVNQMWWSTNYRFADTVEKLMASSYRPFGNSTVSQQVVDPRSYFALHEFLEEESVDPDPHFGLFSTWMETLDEDRENFSKGVAMPFNVNNQDVAVLANSIFGLLSEMLREGGHPSWLTEDVEGTVTSTARLVMWSLQSGRVLERPDITLLYYPSLYDFFFFVGRLAALMDEHGSKLPTQKLRDLAAVFPGTVRPLITDALWSRSGRTNDTFPTQYHWDDFLGLADLNLLGKPAPSFDDRLFSTSLALKSLLDLHTTATCDCSVSHMQDRCMRPDTPQAVYEMLEGAVAFLVEFSLQDTYRPFNAFFSGSSKTPSTCLTCYPANYAQFLNGTVVDFDDVQATYSPELIDGVRGVIDKTQYLADVKKEWFGEPVPQGFGGFNSPGPWPFWSSPAMTHSMEILALSTYMRVQQCQATS